MKLKTTLKRPPWRRKKMPQTRDVGLAQSIGRLIKPRSLEDPPAPAATRAVDPSVYNELVTPRDPALGMGTPDKSHIVYTSRPVVLVYPASDDDPDDDEFGEVQQVPITLYYDARGDVIEDRAWAGLCRSWGRTRGRGGQSHLESGSESEADYRECLGRLKARSWVEGRYMRNYGEEKMSSEGPVSCYWGGRDALKVREVRGVKGKAAKAGVDDGEEASVGRSHSERPIPARCGDGRSVWEAKGRSLVCRYPPDTAHYPHMTSRRTSCHSDPQDVIWSSMCAMYPGVAWASVGGMGGAGEGVWVDPGEAHQYGGTCVATRADPRTPGPVQDSAGNRRRLCRARDKQSHHRHLGVSEDTKLWCRTGERVAYDGRTRGPGMPSMDQLVERPGCGGARQCAAQRGLTPVGTTLPGHTAFAHNLTHIDYDNLRPAWPRKEEVQGYCSGVERRRDTVPHTSSAPPSSDDSSHCHHRHREPRLGPRSSAGDQGRRGEGAWPGGPRVQASGTCGALGQAGPESPVSARTLPRAHARSRHTCSSSSVLSENSVSSESSGVGAVSEDSQSVGDTSVRVNIGDCESWWWYQDGVCEGECTCDMPCKVSGIPVYQGRGGDPPRHSREDVPPAAPPTAAGGRGRGAGRRNVGSKASVTNSSRSPALLGRRSSFGPHGLSRGSTTQDSEVDPQSRTSPSGPGGGHHNTNHSDHTRGAGASSHRARASPSPSTRSPARGTSPGLGIRPPSPAAAGRTSTTMRRRESQGDPRTPPVTPSCRRPPPRAVYQVKLSSGASSRDSPPMHRDKSKLPVMASKSIKNDTSQGTPRTFPPRPGAGRVSSGQRPGKDTVKDREGVDDGKYVEQAGQTSLKLDTPPKSLPLSLSVNSPVSPEAKDDGAGGKTFVDVGGASGTTVTDSDATPNQQSQTSGKTPPVSRTKSTSFLPKAPSPQEKPSGLLRPGSNRLTSSASRLTSGRRNTGDASRPSDSRLDRTLSVSSTHITPKVSVTRTYSGPKSSLADGANRARIVRRVMNGSRTNLSKKKSSSKTSLVVGRHNIYNRSKSGSKSSLLGSRNNLFRASLDSQRTESTTDSGCNSPMYGSQCSLDGDRKRHSSSPCPNLRKRVGSSSFVSMISRSDSDRTNNKDRKTRERRVEATPPSLPIRTPDPTLPGRPERDTQATVIEPDAVDKDIGTDTKSDGSVTETRVCEADAAGRKVKTFHSRYFSGSNLVQKMQKPSVPVKRSSSLQIPSRSKPAPPPKPSPSGLRASSSSLICGNVDGEGKENRPLPGISVSFRSVSSRQPQSYSSYKGLARNNEKEIASQDKKEITKVSIVAEPKTKEEKGIQVEASSSEEDADEDEYDLEEEEREEDEEEEGDGKEEEEEKEKEMITCGGSDSHHGQTEGVSSARSQVRYDGPRNSPQPLPGPFRARDGQPTPERAGKTIAHISVDQEKGKANVTEKMECRSEIEDNRNNEKKASLGDEENHIIQRLETSLADIIDSAVLKNLKINGNILADQFDAIIATLKKVAASVDSGDSADSPPLNRRNSDGGVRAAPKTPISPTTPLTATPVSTSSSSPMSPLSPSTPRSPPSKTPLSLFSISECYPGHAVTPPTFTKNRKLSLPRDSLQDNSPTLAELARRLHANPNHLRADQDYVDFMDLDQPYISPVPTGVSTSDLIRGEPTPKSYGRKNSTGSLGLSSCASLLQDKSYYAGGPTTTASVTNLNSAEDYTHLFGPRQSAFRKVHSTSNVNGAVPGGSHRMFQRHLSLCGPDDVRAENRLRKSLSKSRELLSQLENEYKRIKGDESKSARNSLIIDQSWLDKDFDELLQTLSNDKTIQSDPHETLAFLANSGGHSSSSCASSSSKSDKWRGLKKDTPQPPMADSPRARRHQSVAGTEGRHIFSFFQKKGRSQSLTGTEAIKIALPIMPEYGPQDGDAQGPPRVTYESATLDRPGRTNRSNSIPLGLPHALGGSGLPLDLVGIFKKNRSKSLSKPASTEEEGGEDAPEDEGQQEEEEVEGEDEPAKQMRSLSLPKSFLSDKYGLTGFKAALPSVIFPWRRSEHNRSSGRSSPAPYDTTSQLPATSPSCSQSPSCAHPADSANSSSCEVAIEPKRKDGGVWWRGRAGVSRTTRREKASSSPVFRRASLSHSEWDIRRPWSHVYSEREAAKLSQSVCRLAMTSVEDGGVPGEVVPEGEGPRSLPYMPSNMQSSTEGMFQKFKKSLSLRLAKKGSRSESPSSGSHSAPIDHTHSELTLVESQTLPRRRGSITRDDDNKTSFLFGHPLFRSSKERRRARLKDVRSSKCNSGDSGDSGIELVTTSGQVTSLDMTSHSVDLDAGTYVDPAFMASLAEDGSSSLREVNPRTVRRTHSDVGGAGGRGCVHYSRQLSTPQPIKIRPAHRLPQHTASLHRSKSLKRSKGSSHLRRSVSQPLDLDRAYDTPTSTLRKCRSPTNTSNRRQRRPSAGNILNEDNTTSEDEIGMSDSEDFRTDLKRSLEEVKIIKTVNFSANINAPGCAEFVKVVDQNNDLFQKYIKSQVNSISRESKDDDMIVYAEALWDHVTLDSEELVFKAGDLITVIDSSDKDWWWGRISHRAGWFPAAFVRILVNQEDHLDSRSHDDARLLGPARKLSISGLSHDQIRTNVINEIISTERDFVKHLRDVVKGYLRQVRKRPDMFSDERISTIFGNMEALYQFQSNFLRELEMCIDWQDPHKSCIGAAFTRNREKFEIYSEYCNNHPAAMSSLQELYQDQKYIHFFEACRLLQEMIDISLDGFLLTPVQKICKYPLQLQELLKYTKPDHPDYSSVQGALEAMRDVALLVNERKRRMECLEKIASWQITVEGWEGPELLEDSSQLIYQGEVTKGVGGSWPKDVTLFLFDHQLVYCKRDLLKRNTFVYRGRLNLDVCEIVDLPDGKDSSLNISVHNGWKIHSLEKNKWYVFSCKTATEKHKWMEAFRKERKLVAADESAGFVVAEKAKHLAKVAARNQRNRPKRPRTTKSHKRVQAMTYAQAELLVKVDPEIRSSSLPSGVQPPEGKKKGLWFSFGGHKKGRGSGRNVSQTQHHPV